MPLTPSSPQALRPQKELVIAWTLLLLRDLGENHGYTLHHELGSRGVHLQATGVYRRLVRFERDRWVVSRWTEPVNGPRRHVFELTTDGQAALREITPVIVAMRETYSAFLAEHAHAVARRDEPADDPDDDGVAPSTPETPPAAPDEAVRPPPQAPSPHQRARPHKELVAGWLLLHLDADATYGYDLRRKLDAHRLKPDPGGMYRMLRRLEADGWIQSRWTRSPAGPRRRLYRLTAEGRRNLDETAGLVAAVRDTLDAYLHAYAQAGQRRAPDSEKPVSRIPRPHLPED
jgi:DNA-binding PadR family transcriptional regulator